MKKFSEYYSEKLNEVIDPMQTAKFEKYYSQAKTSLDHLINLGKELNILNIENIDAEMQKLMLELIKNASQSLSIHNNI